MSLDVVKELLKFLPGLILMFCHVTNHQMPFPLQDCSLLLLNMLNSIRSLKIFEEYSNRSGILSNNY